MDHYVLYVAGLYCENHDHLLAQPPFVHSHTYSYSVLVCTFKQFLSHAHSCTLLDASISIQGNLGVKYFVQGDFNMKPEGTRDRTDNVLTIGSIPGAGDTFKAIMDPVKSFYM